LRGASDPVEVIVITGHAEGATVRAAIQLGVVDYLVKPFWPARLTEALASYRNRMQLFESPRLNQESVDCARAVAPESRPAGTGLIRHRRLHQVQAAVAAKGGSVSADEIATLTGMARVTARRYLEHLVALGQCTVDQWPEGPGRPRKMYRPWLSGPVAAPPHSARD
jgi:response regulator of citrate/malate metabolism